MSLEQRVAALESLTKELAGSAASSAKSARRWRFTALAAGLAMIGGVGVAANNGRTRADVITAEMIEIVNGDDDVMIELSSDSYGGLIVVNSILGERAASIEVFGSADDDAYRGLFTACDEDGVARASVTVDDFGGMVRVQATDNEDVGGWLDILDGSGRVYVTNDQGRNRTVRP